MRSAQYLTLAVFATENHRRSTRTEVLQGAPLHLNCTDLPPGCLSSPTHDADGAGGGVSWYLVEDGRTAPRALVADGVDLLLTRDNGLIIMDVSVRHNGTFVCMLGGHTISHHQVHVLRQYILSAVRHGRKITDQIAALENGKLIHLHAPMRFPVLRFGLSFFRSCFFQPCSLVRYFMCVFILPSVW